MWAGLRKRESQCQGRPRRPADGSAFRPRVDQNADGTCCVRRQLYCCYQSSWRGTHPLRQRCNHVCNLLTTRLCWWRNSCGRGAKVAAASLASAESRSATVLSLCKSEQTTVHAMWTSCVAGRMRLASQSRRPCTRGASTQWGNLVWVIWPPATLLRGSRSSTLP